MIADKILWFFFLLRQRDLLAADRRVALERRFSEGAEPQDNTVRTIIVVIRSFIASPRSGIIQMSSNPAQEVPHGYVLSSSLELSKRWFLTGILSVGSIVLIYPFFGVFLRILACIRPELETLNLALGGAIELLVAFALLMIGTLGLIVIHESVHGLFFWVFSKKRPVFGFKVLFAYAGAPGCYFTKAQFLIIAIAPLFCMSVVGVGLFLVFPASWLSALILALAFNAAGSIGDLAVCIWLLLKPKKLLANDTGIEFRIYLPEKAVDTDAASADG
jgi:hypothetical protein